MSETSNVPVLVGHPFIPTGRGEDIRCSFRSLQAARTPVTICDLWPHQDCSDRDIEEELSRHTGKHLSSTLNIFYLNGDEVEKALSRTGDGLPATAYNVICPQWELSAYPQEWTEKLNRFDEIWAPSRFVLDALTKATSKPVFHLPLAMEGKLTSFLGRRHFDLPESAYLFLLAFDLRSYLERKNPLAAMQAFAAAYAQRPGSDMRLVIKLHGADSTTRSRSDFERFIAAVDRFPCRGKVIVINELFTDNEAKNLVRCCDCVMSLHRSEGFGRVMAEAMLLGKPVVATGYSGNLDFMSDSNSCLVQYKLLEVPENAYPHAQGQVWAEPDVDHAVFYMLKLLDNRDFGRELGQTASRHIRTHFSHRAMGLRYKMRIDEILCAKPSPGKHTSLERQPRESPAQS